MRRPPKIPLPRNFSTARRDRPSLGFSGAGFLGCYHVGAVACLHRHGWLPRPDDDSYGTNKMPLLTGVSAGSMIAAATLAGVDPETDGMEVVLEAARRTRELTRRMPKRRDGGEGKSSNSRPGAMENFGASLDVFTPGFSLIDQVDGPFRDAMVKALGGYCERDRSNNVTVHDVDPDLFARRFPDGSLRIGLTDRRELWPPPFLNSYRYVDAYRDVEDVWAACMLSSYIPGGTGPLNMKEAVPDFVGRLLSNSGWMDTNRSENKIPGNDASDRAGSRLKEMTELGMVKHGNTGLPILDVAANDEEDEDSKDGVNRSNEPATYYWDGGLVDVFPTFDDDTVIVTPLNGLFDPNPSISPRIPDVEFKSTLEGASSNSILQKYLPTTFRHCPKSHLGLNSKNADTALRMAISSDDDELHTRFREGYDDARRFLDQRGQLTVFSG